MEGGGGQEEKRKRQKSGEKLTEEGGEGTEPGRKQSQVSFLTFGSSTFMSFYYGIWVSMKFIFQHLNVSRGIILVCFYGI